MTMNMTAEACEVLLPVVQKADPDARRVLGYYDADGCTWAVYETVTDMLSNYRLTDEERSLVATGQ